MRIGTFEVCGLHVALKQLLCVVTAPVDVWMCDRMKEVVIFVSPPSATSFIARLVSFLLLLLVDIVYTQDGALFRVETRGRCGPVVLVGNNSFIVVNNYSSD